MRTRQLLRNVRHRAMIMPVSPLRTELIHISRVWDNLSFVCNYSRMGTFRWLGIQIL